MENKRIIYVLVIALAACSQVVMGNYCVRLNPFTNICEQWSGDGTPPYLP